MVKPMNKRQRKKAGQAIATNGATTGTRRQYLAQQAGQSHAGARDLYEALGYKRNLSVEDFYSAYHRQDIAGRIVDAYPDATWREPPAIEGTDAFISAFEELNKKHKVWKEFHTQDRLMNMGHYGVLLLGLDGGEPLETPATGSNYDLIYLQAYSERAAEITTWEDDPQSPRFGMPKFYRITTGVDWTGSGAGQKTITAHYSRVIHTAEKVLENKAIGTPRLERVFNRLQDCDKLLGGSAEMYWQNVSIMLAFLADKDADLSPESSQDMKDQITNMYHGLERSLRLRGVGVKNIAPGLQGSSPGEHLDKQISFISGASGIPQRILIGNEQGERASSQDENNWQGRIAERRSSIATNEFVEPFIDAGQRLGFLPAGYNKTVWPESDTLGEEGRANVALSTAQAVATYQNAIESGELVTKDEFRAIFGLDPMTPEQVAEIEYEDDLEEDTDAVSEFERMRANRAKGV